MSDTILSASTAASIRGALRRPRAVLYLRGPKASGKSTLVSILVRRHGSLFHDLFRRWPVRLGEQPTPDGRRMPPEQYVARMSSGSLIGEARVNGAPSAIGLDDLKAACSGGRVIVTESVLTLAMLRQIWPEIAVCEIGVLPLAPGLPLTTAREQELIATLAVRLRHRKPHISGEQLARDLSTAVSRFGEVGAASVPIVVNPQGASLESVYATFEREALSALVTVTPQPDMHDRSSPTLGTPLETWKRRWDQLLSISQWNWRTQADPFDTLRSWSSPLAHDPWDPWRHSRTDLGFVQYLQTDLPSEVEGLCVPRHLAPHLRGRTLFHELFNALVSLPHQRGLVVVPNRWPRVPYQALLISDTWQPQRLTQQFLSAQFDWAQAGAVAEFHRRALPVDHLHGHLFLPEFVTVTRYLDRFRERRRHDEVSTGVLQDFPLCHLALSSTSREALHAATLSYASHLEDGGHWFYEVIVRNPGTPQLFALFTLWRQRQGQANQPIYQRARIAGVDLSIGFNASGILRSSPQVNLDADAVKGRLRADYFVSDDDAHTASDQWFEQRATRRASALPAPSPQPSLVAATLAAFKAWDARWSHAEIPHLEDADQRALFQLYLARYSKFRLKFAPTEEGYLQFSDFYHDAFVLRNGGRIMAFVLSRRRQSHLVLNLTASEPGWTRVVVRALPSALQVSGVYGLVSGRLMEHLVKAHLRPPDVLRVRMEGRFAFPHLPVVNPRLASELLSHSAGLGLDAWPDADGTHCLFRPQNSQDAPQRGLLLGNPVVDSATARLFGSRVVLEDSVLVASAFEQLRTSIQEPQANMATVHGRLMALLRNPHLFASHPLEAHVNHSQVAAWLAEPGVLNDLLELWRIASCRVRLVAAAVALKNRNEALEGPTRDEISRAADRLARIQQALSGLPPVMEDDVGARVENLAAQAWDEWGRSCRVILTDRFKRNVPVVASGELEVRAHLLRHILQTSGPCVVGIAGPSGVGKSTLATALAEACERNDRPVVVVETDGFLTGTFLAGGLDPLTAALRLGIFQDTVWDMPAYQRFLERLAAAKIVSPRDVMPTVTIENYYERVQKRRVTYTFSMSPQAVVIVEGWGAVLPRLEGVFNCSVFLDVSDDQVLVRRMADREPAKADLLARRVSALDRPASARLALQGAHRAYRYLLDQTALEDPRLYDVRGSEAVDGSDG